jgi:hypothetical protein
MTASLLIASLFIVGQAEKPLPPDLALVPPDAALMFVVDLARLQNGPDKEALQKVSAAHPVVLTHELPALTKIVGLRPEEIARAVLIAAGPQPASEIAILTTVQALDRDKVLAAIVPGAEEKKIGGKSFFANAQGEKAVALIDNKTIVVGAREAVKALLERPAGASGPLQPALQSAAKDKTFVVLAVNPALVRAAAKNAGPGAEHFLPLLEAQSWETTFKPEKGLQLRVRAEFADKEAAQKGRAALDKVLPLLDNYLKMVETQMPKFFKSQEEKYPGVRDVAGRMETAAKAAQTGLQKAMPQIEGNILTLTIQMATDEPAVTTALLLSLMPRAKKN